MALDMKSVPVIIIDKGHRFEVVIEIPAGQIGMPVLIQQRHNIWHISHFNKKQKRWIYRELTASEIVTVAAKDFKRVD